MGVSCGVGSDGKVVGPVPSCAARPSGGGGDVDAEHVRGDGGGDLPGPGSSGCVSSGAGSIPQVRRLRASTFGVVGLPILLPWKRKRVVSPGRGKGARPSASSARLCTSVARAGGSGTVPLPMRR